MDGRKAEVYSAATFGRSSYFKSTDTADEQDRSIVLIVDHKDLSLLTLAKDLFVVPADKDRFVLYSAGASTCLLINSIARELLEDIRSRREINLDRRTIAILNYFILNGVLQFGPDDEPSNEPGIEQQDEKDAGRGFYEPVSVGFSLTTDCNLKCIYCFASGGKNPRCMDSQLVRRSIDFVVGNAIKRKQKLISVDYVGGGEPMLAFDLVRQSVEYAKEQSSSHGLECSLVMATNLCYDRKRLDYLMKHFNHIGVSLDGPGHIQDRQRPMRDGSGSFDVIDRNLHILDKMNLKYVLRSTVTKFNLPMLSEIIEFFANNYGTNMYFLDIVAVAGRAVDSRCEHISPDEFLEAFLKAREVARRYGKRLDTFTSDIFEHSRRYCGGVTEGFWVTPEGNVSTCGEVLDSEDPLAKHFIVGRYDRDNDEFVFDKDKILWLQRRDVDAIDSCRDCLAKYHCKGYCPVHMMRLGAGFMDTEGAPGCYCDFTKSVVKLDLIDLLERKECQITDDDFLALGDPDSLSDSDFMTSSFVVNKY